MDTSFKNGLYHHQSINGGGNPHPHHPHGDIGFVAPGQLFQQPQQSHATTEPPSVPSQPTNIMMSTSASIAGAAGPVPTFDLSFGYSAAHTSTAVAGGPPSYCTSNDPTGSAVLFNTSSHALNMLPGYPYPAVHSPLAVPPFANNIQPPTTPHAVIGANTPLPHAINTASLSLNSYGTINSAPPNVLEFQTNILPATTSSAGDIPFNATAVSGVSAADVKPDIKYIRRTSLSLDGSADATTPVLVETVNSNQYQASPAGVMAGTYAYDHVLSAKTIKTEPDVSAVVCHTTTTGNTHLSTPYNQSSGTDSNGLTPMALAKTRGMAPPRFAVVANRQIPSNVTVTETPPLTAQCSDDEDNRGGSTRKPSHSSNTSFAGYWVGYQDSSFLSSLASSPASPATVKTEGQVSVNPSAISATTPKPSKKRSRKSAGGNTNDAASKRQKTALYTATSNASISLEDHKCEQLEVGPNGEIKCPHPACDKSFTRKYNLKSHERTHHDDRPYKCDQCGRSFSRNHDLKRHKKIHTGDRPFQCQSCGRGFARADALSRHTSKGPTCKRTAAANKAKAQHAASTAKAVKAAAQQKLHQQQLHQQQQNALLFGASPEEIQLAALGGATTYPF